MISFRAFPCLQWSFFFSLFVVSCGQFLRVSELQAHPISLTESVLDVQSEQIDVELKVLIEDLVLYYSVSSDENNVYSAEELRQAAESHRAFVIDGLRLLDEDGRHLSGQIVSVDSSQIPDAGVAQTDIKQVSVSYSLRYPIPQRLPFLTVSQKFGGDEAILPAMMDCKVKQLGVVLDVAQPIMSGQTLTTRFDWSRPPEPPKNWRELQQRRNDRLRQQLGIASYSGLYSFFYITPHEVRHEILIPLLTLDEWVSITRAKSDYLDVAEQKFAATRITEFFESGNTVLINGDVVKPVVARLSFFGLDISDFAKNAEPRRVSVAQARVGVILSYPSISVPISVGTKWETFSKYAPFLKSVVYEFDEEPVEHFFRPDQPEFKWTSRRVEQQGQPLVAQLKSDKRRPSTEQAEQISSTLVRNVYRAFDLYDEKETYAALKSVVDGALLRTLYLQIRRSLLMAEQGGSRSRVLSVKPVSGMIVGDSSSSGFEMEYRWRVAGEVEHWGHIHTRENEYRAMLSVSSVDGYWKLHGVKFLSQKRVRFETRLRQRKVD